MVKCIELGGDGLRVGQRSRSEVVGLEGLNSTAEDEVTPFSLRSRYTLAAEQKELEVGDTIGGYQLVERLGDGSSGQVFRAKGSDHAEDVAIKVLNVQRSQMPLYVERFRAEFEMAQQIHHPGLVKAFRYLEEGYPSRQAFVMELVRGKLMRSHLKDEGPFSLETAVRVAIQMGEVLSVLHKAGWIHRDLKPENILLVGRETQTTLRVKLFDFGVVASTSGPSICKRFVGTPRYMAPEQVARTAIDHRADLFSLGVILFEMITGKCPHNGVSLRDVLLAKLKQTPRIYVNPNQEVLPRILVRTLDRCLRLRPQERPRDTQEVVDALREALVILLTAGTVYKHEATLRKPLCQDEPHVGSQTKAPVIESRANGFRYKGIHPLLWVWAVLLTSLASGWSGLTEASEAVRFSSTLSPWAYHPPGPAYVVQTSTSAGSKHQLN